MHPPIAHPLLLHAPRWQNLFVHQWKRKFREAVQLVHVPAHLPMCLHQTFSVPTSRHFIVPELSVVARQVRSCIAPPRTLSGRQWQNSSVSAWKTQYPVHVPLHPVQEHSPMLLQAMHFVPTSKRSTIILLSRDV